MTEDARDKLPYKNAEILLPEDELAKNNALSTEPQESTNNKQLNKMEQS